MIKENKLAPGVISAQSTLAVRVTKHPLLKEIIKQLDRPLVSTSANLSGFLAIYRSSEIIQKFDNVKLSPDFFVDLGNLPKNEPSTIVLAVDNEFKVLRQGGLRLDK